MDYLKYLKEAFDFTLKYKSLWVFGLVIALFSSSGTEFNNFPTPNSSSSSKSSTAEYNQTLLNIVNSPAFWISIIALVLVLLVIAVIGCYLKNVSKAALMNAVKHEFLNAVEKIKVKSLWKESKSVGFKLMLYDLVWLLIYIPIVLVLFAPFSLVFFAPEAITAFLGIFSLIASIGIFCCLLVFAILGFIYLGLCSTAGQRLIVYKNMGVIDAVKQSFKIVKTRFKDIFVLALLSIIPGIIFSTILFFITIISAAIIFLPIIGLALASPDLLLPAILVSIVAGLFLGVVIAAISSPYYVFSEVYWNKYYIELPEVFEK